MKSILPQRGKWTTSNRGDIFGLLWATFNIDLTSNRGKIRISPRAKVNTDVDDSAGHSDPVSAFVRGDFDGTDRWWALWGNALAKTASTDPSGDSPQFSADAIGAGDGTPTDTDYDESDMVAFNGDLVVSSPTDLHKLSGGSWDQSWWATTLSQSALTGNVPHPLHVSKSSRRLLIGDGNKVHAVDTNNNVATDIVILPEQYRIVWIRSSNDRNWIGTWNKRGDRAMIFEYTELQENYDNGYEIDSDIAMAGLVKNGICYAILRNGALSAFSGGGFKRVAALPILADATDNWDDAENSVYGFRMVHPNGMTLIGENIHILLGNEINNARTSEKYNRFYAGIWEYDEEIGLYHKYSISQYDGTENDYGVTLDYDETGALVELNRDEGVFLASTEFRAGGSKGIHTVINHTSNTLDKRGFIITSYFYSSEISDAWDSIWFIFKQLENADDKIIVKYRVKDDVNLPTLFVSGTWSDTDTITTTESGAANISAGDELFIMTGLGAGASVHISSISESGGTYTINLDEVVPNASSGAVRFIVQNWTKLTEFSTQNVSQKQFSLGQDAEWIQFKIELRGNGNSPELDRLIVSHYPTTYAEN